MEIQKNNTNDLQAIGVGVPKTLEQFKEQTRQLKPWAWLDDLLLLVHNDIDFGTVKVYLDGGRLYGKTYRACDFTAKAMLMKPQQLDAYLLRWQKQDSNELKDETIDAVERAIGREVGREELNKSTKTFTINGNVLRVMGIHTPSTRKKVKLTGIRRAKGKKYAIIVFEEAYEFNQKEFNDLLHAVGGYQNYIIFYITNPNSLALPFIKAREKEFPHNEAILATKGFQFKQQRTKEREHTIWFYGNWRINEFISEADVNKILDTKETDPARARVVDLGMPGIEDNGIYAYELPKIKKMPLKEILHTRYLRDITAGIDWGDGTTPEASATTLVISGLGEMNETYVLDTYKHQNFYDGYKTPQQRIDDMLDVIREFVRLFPRIEHNGLAVYFDTGLHAEIEMFRLACEARNMNYVEARFATKHMERTRINIRKYRINTGRYYVAEHITNIIEELSLQVWDETKKDKQGLPKQQDANNHLTDAEDYALCEYTYSIIDEEKYRLLHKKW